MKVRVLSAQHHDASETLHLIGNVYEVASSYDDVVTIKDKEGWFFGLHYDDYEVVDDEYEENTTTPKPFGELSDEEKGALLLAHHEGKGIEYWNGHEWELATPFWLHEDAYRIKPEPQVSEITVTDVKEGYDVTWNEIDGVPDCGSVKMVKVS